MSRPVLWGIVSCVVAATSGCAARAPGDQPTTMDALVPFNGTWSVAWCDKENPALDCGGFTVTLVQNGNRICGEFAGALVNLRQVDEGDVRGTADGDIATLAVRSGRNDSILRIRATRVGRDLHWKAAAQRQKGVADIDVIALDEVLTPASGPARLVPETCEARTA